MTKIKQMKVFFDDGQSLSIPEKLRTTFSHKVYRRLHDESWQEVKKSLGWFDDKKDVDPVQLNECFRVGVSINDCNMVKDILAMGLGLQGCIRFAIKQSVESGYPEMLDLVLSEEVAQEGQIIGNMSGVTQEICVYEPSQTKIDLLKVIQKHLPASSASILSELASRGDSESFKTILQGCESGMLSDTAVFNIACDAAIISFDGLKILQELGYDLAAKDFLTFITGRPGSFENRLVEVLECVKNVNFKEHDKLNAMTNLLAKDYLKALFEVINTDETLFMKNLRYFLTVSAKVDSDKPLKFILPQVTSAKLVEKMFELKSLNLSESKKGLLIERVLQIQSMNMKAAIPKKEERTTEKETSKKSSFRL